MEKTASDSIADLRRAYWTEASELRRDVQSVTDKMKAIKPNHASVANAVAHLGIYRDATRRLAQLLSAAAQNQNDPKAVEQKIAEARRARMSAFTALQGAVRELHEVVAGG